jgi:hypothetical protein
LALGIVSGVPHFLQRARRPARFSGTENELLHWGHLKSIIAIDARVRVAT